MAEKVRCMGGMNPSPTGGREVDGYVCRGRRPRRPAEVRGCERGPTVERSEIGERTMFAPAGQTTA